MDIRRDHFSTVVSDESTKNKLEHALRCVLYEMVVLALALVQLKSRGVRLLDETSGQTLPFGEEQTAHEAASLTCRVLIDFLYPERKKGNDTSTPTDLKELYKSLNKWAAHLDWKRVKKSKEYPQSYPEVLLEHGPTILAEASRFVDDCINNYQYKLTSPNAEQYYNKFLELKTRLADM